MVVVVYCWHQNSKSLDLGQLFHPDLEDHLEHPLLLSLRNQQCFFSIYKKFSDFQRQLIIKKIQLSLESKAVVPAGSQITLTPTGRGDSSAQ